MTFIAEIQALVAALGGMPGLDVDTSRLVASVEDLSDDDLVVVMSRVAELRTCIDRLAIVAAGVTGRRSRRERGHGGLAAVRGFRTPAAMVQAITGGTAATAKKAVQVGESLLSGQPDPSPDSVSTVTWDEPLRRALLSGAITLDQHAAIRTGLGEPPHVDGESAETVRDVWSIAAEQLIAQARTMAAEDLLRRARTVRDLLDPAGAEDRFAARYANRSFRTWIDAVGQHHGHIVFDDEMGVWVQAMKDAALRPRRGGPRFVDSAERAAADALERDPRTNDQLAYDLLVDVLKAGALASAADVFGARQPGVRLIVTADAVGRRDAFGRMLATGCTEDRGVSLPGSVVDRNVCESGTVTLTFDPAGNPLDLGREQRLFSRAQRVMLAVRDGGCRWPSCDRPASYCEAHHADHWHEDGGRTDIDRGILLCRHHHMLLHNNGWKITREGRGCFVLHAPAGSGADPVVLEGTAAWAWMWDPPPDRPSWRAAREPVRAGG